jgi:hypothetical protein
MDWLVGVERNLPVFSSLRGHSILHYFSSFAVMSNVGKVAIVVIR